MTIIVLRDPHIVSQQYSRENEKLQNEPTGSNYVM